MANRGSASIPYTDPIPDKEARYEERSQAPGGVPPTLPPRNVEVNDKVTAQVHESMERKTKVPSPEGRSADGLGGLSVMDLLRVLGGLLLLSSGMSYLWTSGESMTWGYNPWWTRAREWKSLMQGEIRLTDEQLRAYDGTDPKKPIYLALNGTIYDVSANPKTYGPGGSYHFFAGRDAARAFITGCFQEDLTPDLRGVEMMYIPKDPVPTAGPSPPSNDSNDPENLRSAHQHAKAHDKRRTLSPSELKMRREKEMREAMKKVAEGLESWEKMFRGEKGKPYFRVGRVVREKGWLEKLPRRDLCDYAENSRPIREDNDEDAVVKE